MNAMLDVERGRFGQDRLALRPFTHDDELPFFGQFRASADERRQVLDLAQSGQRTDPGLSLPFDETRQGIPPGRLAIGTNVDPIGDTTHATAWLIPDLERDPLQRP